MSEKIKEIKKRVQQMRIQALETAYRSGKEGAHLGPAFSLAEVNGCLFHGVMRHDPKIWPEEERDWFLLSKGHGVLSYYPYLVQCGYITEETLYETFERKDSVLAGHPCRHDELGIPFSTGSLGHGLSLGVGLALGLKRSGKKGLVYVVMGDGETNEGSVWEAAMSAAHYGLDNLVAIIDRNRIQSDGISREIIDMGDVAAKWKAFGFETRECNGHSVEQLMDVLQDRNRAHGRPLAIVAHTVKGKGVSFFENNNTWHRHVLPKDLYDLAMAEVCGGGEA